MAALVWPRKHGQGHVFAALPGRRAQRRLLRAVASVPCQLDLLNFGFNLPNLTESPPKVNGYFVGFNHPLNGDLGSSSSLHTMDLGSNKQSFISIILYRINMQM